ncbi:MAG TPA: thioesterase family protein [Candidatus Corynebacterium avicola]|uniref:Thioesterase family protein n=1 Tax=Candidatus Corynebacterium avicola TaxID=2838527 RepID=A0A9D1RT12_9CORY|nr:thioesterase family protein [Candidatus Corynebacterium avicola]
MTSTTDAYFLPGPESTTDTGRYLRTFTATEHTESPWGRGFQHGSPPAALVTHVLEQLVPDSGRLTRVTTELLGAVPLGELHATGRVVRPGKRICLVEAVVTDPSGREVIRGTGWWVRTRPTTDIENPDVPSGAGMVPLEEASSSAFSQMWSGGYIDSLETQGAPGQLWLRSRIPVVADAPDTPWTRLAAVADVANGTNPTVDPRAWSFMNTDLSIYLHRLPRGEWIGVSAEANYGPDGIGLTIGRLHDQDGPVGSTSQSLMLDPIEG